MKTKFFFLTTILVLGLALAACVPSTISVPPVSVSVPPINVPPITVQPQVPQRTITVSGTGKVTLTPDIAYVSIGVQTQDASATTAMEANNTKAQAIIAAIKAAGVEDKDIQTTNFSIYPQQQYDKDGNMTGILYVVNNTVYLTARDLTKLGGLLDATVQSGANTINSISFDVADKTAALSQARLAAVTDAAKQANELTSAAGVSLDDVQTISYYDTSAPITVQYARAAMDVAGGSVPIQSGSMDITTTVTIVYELK
jgi:uncharacterized protein